MGECFMNKYFGTDGIRGKVNYNLTSRIVFRLGRYLGARGKLKILLARDTRISSDLLFSSFCSGALGSGSSVYDLGIAPTPAVSYLTAKYHFDYGVMITASHNPYDDNGIKIFDRNGEKIKDDLKKEIESYIDAKEDYLPLAASDHIGRLIESSHLIEEYIEFLLENKEHINHNLKVVVDGANGADYQIIETLFKRLNLKHYELTNVKPNGININRDSGVLDYEILQKKVVNGKFDLGIAVDGDGDRIIACDSEGRLLDGDLLLMIFALDLKKQNLLKENRIVVTTMTNSALLKKLKEHQIEADVVDVGDHNVQMKMSRINASLGGEKSGHIIFGDFAKTGDALLSMMKLMILMSEKESLKKVYDDYNPYPTLQMNIQVVDKNNIINNQRLLDYLNASERELKGQGRIVIRPSGTESLIRVLIESESEKKNQEIGSFLRNLIFDLDIG